LPRASRLARVAVSCATSAALVSKAGRPGRERRDEQSRLLAAFDDGSLTAEEFSRQFEALEPVPGPTIAVLLDERARAVCLASHERVRRELEGFGGRRPLA